MTRTLLAKSPRLDAPSDSETLLGHSEAVARCMNVIVGCLPEEGLAALGLHAENGPKLLARAAWLHDIGKANSAFQKLITGKTAKRQPVRHEVLGGLLLTDGRLFGDYLRERLGEETLWLLTMSIGGHHLKMPEKDFPNLFRLEGSESRFTLFANHGDLRAILERAFGDGPPPSMTDLDFETIEGLDDSIEPWLRSFLKQARRVSGKILSDPKARLKLAACKTLLIAADVAGSAVTAQGGNVEDYVQTALAKKLTPADLEPVIADRLKGQPPRPFQLQVADSDFPVTLVTAGCGNGKTLAAYLWAARRGIGRKLFFTYPTTGTASAGFADYLLAQTDLERALIHGRAEVDLEAMRPPDEDDGFNQSLRIEALQAWSQKVVACTVDAVLGLIQNQRRGIYSFPALIDGAFVFDEIHNYDRYLFGALLRFLEVFRHSPVLLMTASLPPGRLEALRNTLGSRLGPIIFGDERLEQIPRYLPALVDSPQDCWPAVEAALASNEKVLWVANTVRTAVEIYRTAEAKGYPGLVYHSRFRYGDRVGRQNEVLSGFARPGAPCLVVSTQVCEMSLDISADLLISAVAPLPAIIQRLGRLNRRVAPDSLGIPRPALFYPQAGKPYKSDELEKTRPVLDDLAGKEISQVDLRLILDQYVDEKKFPTDSAWLDGGWETRSDSVREASYTITVLREEDLDRLPTRPTLRDLLPLTIPMPLYGAPDSIWERRLKGYPVAPRGAIVYQTSEGAEWAK